MERTESAQTRANRNYRKRKAGEGTFKQVGLAFWLPREQAVYDHLCKQANKAGYIKSLIERDMEG